MHHNPRTQWTQSHCFVLGLGNEAFKGTDARSSGLAHIVHGESCFPSLAQSLVILSCPGTSSITFEHELVHTMPLFVLWTRYHPLGAWGHLAAWTLALLILCTHCLDFCVLGCAAALSLAGEWSPRYALAVISPIFNNHLRPCVLNGQRWGGVEYHKGFVDPLG